VKIAPSRPTVVSAYLDGKAVLIEKQVLKGVDQFEKAQCNAPEDLNVVVDGQRRSRLHELARFTAFTVLPVAGGVALGAAAAWAGEPVAGMMIGGLLATGLGGAGLKNLPLAFTAPGWQAGQRYHVNHGSQPTPVELAGVQRLRNLIETNHAEYPGQRHVVYLSGHGDGKKLVDIPVPELPSDLPDVALTVLDACKCSQLEVLAQIAPWSGLLLSSGHEVPARGLPIPEMLTPANLEQPVKLAEIAAPSVISLSLIDGDKLQSEVLPALDELGQQLVTEIEGGSRRAIRKALADSPNPDLWGSRANLPSFLDNLAEQPLQPETLEKVDQARTALSEAILYSKNQHSLSFDLKRGRDSQALPEGWRDFLREFDINRKPMFQIIPL
jgi:hypothetical protein